MFPPPAGGGRREVHRGAPTGGEGPAPLGPEKIMFSGFLPVNYAICIFEVCFKLLLCERTEEACRIMTSLRKVDFLHPSGHCIRKKLSPAPIEKILGAPLDVPTVLQPDGCTGCNCTLCQARIPGRGDGGFSPSLDQGWICRLPGARENITVCGVAPVPASTHRVS